MRIVAIVPLLVGWLFASPAAGGGFNLTYLVPAYVACPGPELCFGTPQRESSFTFESAVLRSPRGRLADAKKPSFILELKGVKDASGAAVSGEGFTIRLSTGQVNVFEPTALSLPAGHPLAQVAPIPLSLTNGSVKKTYKSGQAAGSGTVAEGGGVSVYDSAGKRLAIVGSQFK